ncbi:MAG: SMC-Scp complex subunit ScpB [Kiritimatiellia bacterium]|jgi:segregation and condensation protein B|nr:SMC-Scp complex subunit ScpB [Kiritimatiellia bacterium]
MSNSDVLPELKQILGAMIFGADRPIGIPEMLRCLKDVAENKGGEMKVFAEVNKKDVQAAVDSFAADVENARVGFSLGQVAGGYRLQSDSSCGVWLRHLLRMEKPQRLSRPALETLSIIAYRQPATKAQIEAIRGVSVDHMIKSLMELQLVRIVGRSDLPGRPFLYGTTHVFLEHFGLNSLKDLNQVEPMLSIRRELSKPKKESAQMELPEQTGAVESPPEAVLEEEPEVAETDQ